MPACPPTLRSHPLRHHAAVALVLLLGLAACGSGATGAGDGDAADLAQAPGAASGDGQESEPGAGLEVVAAVYPLAWMAEQVAPAADVTLLVSQGQDPHDLELGPRDRELLETADVVLHMGPIDFQSQVEAAVESSSGHVLAVSEVLGEDNLIPFGESPEDDHGEDHDDDHGDDHGGVDPHVWFDPARMAAVSRSLGEAFATADPGAAEAFRANADALAEELESLEAEIAAALSGDCAHDRVIVSHEAYAYLLRPYGLAQEGVSAVGGHGGGSPQRIAALADEIREQGIGHVLAEPVEGRSDAEAVAAEAGVELLPIYSLDIIEADHFQETGYVGLLRQQAETVAKALGCG